MVHRRCWVEVDGRALRQNLRVVRGLVPPSTLLLAVIKANAYGHGLVAMAKELAALRADWLGVANVAEGILLREAGVKLPILLLSATLPEEMEEAVRHNLTLILSFAEEARRLSRHALALKKKAQAHFKIDTGMGRLGCWHAHAREELAKMRRLPGLAITGLCTHFAAADENVGLTREQWKFIEPFFAEHPELLRHAANSPAIVRRYGFHADMVRAGLAIYGVAPTDSEAPIGLQPVLTWKSRVSLLHEVGRGRTVSYGATYRVRRPERHAVVAMGYGDGYFRLHSNASHLLVRGRRCPIRGRVTMDQIMVDVSKVPGCRIGDEVVALGRQGEEEIRARELAIQAHTIPWEILTNIGPRVPRVYRNFKTA
jgi:alanine racemase